MKKFLKGVLEWKSAVCFMYTGAMAFYLFFCLVFNHQQVPVTLLWTLLLVCAVGALLQAVCYSEWIIKKMRYTLRSLLFVALFLPALSVAAWLGGWFPIERAESWAMFIGMFFVTFIIMTIGFDIYFRITGRKYDGILGQYRREKEEE